MARTLSWLDRLFAISHTVEGSSRSHYDRKHLQELFEIQPRSAQSLMTAMPIVSVGNTHLVEREELLVFLRQLAEAENPTQAFASLRSQPLKTDRRKLRALFLQDVSSDINSLPDGLLITLGRVAVDFQTVDQLAETMIYLAALLQDHLEEFALRFEPPQAESERDHLVEQEARAEMNYLEDLKS